MKYIITESQYNLIIENNDESNYLSELKNDMSNLEQEYSDVITRYKMLKTKIDEIEERQNVPYNLYISMDRGYGKYICAKFKYKDKWPSLHLMKLDDYNKLSDDDKKQALDDKIQSYLKKHYPITK
jgi:hypothetical protein